MLLLSLNVNNSFKDMLECKKKTTLKAVGIFSSQDRKQPHKTNTHRTDTLLCLRAHSKFYLCSLDGVGPARSGHRHYSSIFQLGIVSLCHEAVEHSSVHVNTETHRQQTRQTEGLGWMTDRRKTLQKTSLFFFSFFHLPVAQNTHRWE